MNIRVIVEFDSEVQAYAAYCPELPGCTSAGMTEEEALENIREAVELFFTPDDKPIENRRVYQISVQMPKRFTTQQIEKILKSNGFLLVSQKGSHKKWKNMQTGNKGMFLIIVGGTSLQALLTALLKVADQIKQCSDCEEFIKLL